MNISIDDRFVNRIEELTDSAIEENIAINQKSYEQMLWFVKNNNDLLYPSVFLNNVGNYRLTWEKQHIDEDDDSEVKTIKNGNMLGMQFIGDGNVQYVIIDECYGHIVGTMPVEDTAYRFPVHSCRYLFKERQTPSRKSFNPNR